MKFTKKQLQERENLEWFCDPKNPVGISRFGEASDEAFAAYLKVSERGVYPCIPCQKDVRRRKNERCETCETAFPFNFYIEAKRRRGMTIHELWEDSFYKDESWIGFNGLLVEEQKKPKWLPKLIWDHLPFRLREMTVKPIPRHIAEFISKEIFAGQDRQKIMACYNKISQ